MKNYSLSTYQKQQYTQYLQTQLEKFSSFMLQQKKQNQKYRCLENIIEEQSQHIRKVDDRIRLLELYQRDNYRDSNEKCEKWRTSQFQSRLKRVESMYFQKSTQKENYDSNCAYGEINTLREELFKKIKVIEKDIKKISHQKQKHYKNNQNSPLCTAYSDVQSIHTNQNVATRLELKKMEDKLFSMFDKNFTRIERMIRKSVNRKIKNMQQKDQSTKTRKTREDILIQEHTFGNSKNQFNDYAIDHQNKSVAERSSVSETSGRLYPVKYFSEKQMQKENEKRKPRVKNQSRSKSLPREKSRSVKKSRSKSVSRSKSIKNERSHSKNSKKPTQKTQNSKLQKTPQKHSKQKSRDNLNLINQYKKMCKKKHF